jgi:hypothetical protein
MAHQDKGHLEVEDRGTVDHTQTTQGATIMSTNDTPDEGVITSYAQARRGPPPPAASPTRTVNSARRAPSR